MKPLISLLIVILGFASSCKKNENSRGENGTPTKFEIHTDQPFSNLTVTNKNGNKVIFETNSASSKKTYYDQSGNQIFQYSETINVSVGDRIEFSIPKKNDRKILKIAVYDNKFFQGMQEYNDRQLVIFNVPEKL